MTALVAVLLFTAVAAGALLWQRRRAGRAARWPVTEGRIVANGLQPVPPPASRQPPGYIVTVRYAYRVGERAYEGSRISFATPTRYLHAGAAERARERLPVGAAVRVRYDPARPEEAVLDLEP